MENLALLIGGIGLLICAAGLAVRLLLYKRNVERRNGIFKAYLVMSGLVGLALIISGLMDIPSPWDILLALLIFGWNPVSVLATFTAPPRWSIFPISYICLCTLFCLYFVLTGDEFTVPSRPFIAIFSFGATLVIGSTVALWLRFKSQQSQTIHQIKQERKST
jgi:hypothetical protein